MAAENNTAEMRRILGTHDLYSILGVAKSCSPSELKKSYRVLAMRYHPDKNKQKGADEVFKRVSAAYSILSDAEKRTKYESRGCDNVFNDNQRTSSSYGFEQEFHRKLSRPARLQHARRFLLVHVRTDVRPTRAAQTRTSRASSPSATAARAKSRGKAKSDAVAGTPSTPHGYLLHDVLKHA